MFVCLPVNDDGQPRFIDRANKFFFFFFLVIPLKYRKSSVSDWWRSTQCVRSVERETNHEKLHKLTFLSFLFCTLVRYCRLKTSRVVPDNESIWENNQKRLHAKWTAERSDRIHVSVLRYRWTSVRRAVSLRPDDNTKRLLQDVSTALI